MKRSFSISTPAIICLALLFSIVLMGLLFITHQKKSNVNLNQEEAMIFPVGREMHPFKLTTADHQIFTPQNFLHHWTLLVFGFTHCANVCPVTLTMLSQAYPKLNSLYPNLQVILISLDPERDHQKILNQYVKKFHSKFIGVSGPMESLRKLQSDLGVYAIRDTNSVDNYQIQHSSSILLINPQGKWVGMFKYGLSDTQFTQAFINNLRLLS